jgi:hypothetical protein
LGIETYDDIYVEKRKREKKKFACFGPSDSTASWKKNLVTAHCDWLNTGGLSPIKFSIQAIDSSSKKLIIVDLLQ